MCACGIFSLQSTKEKGARSVNVVQLTRSDQNLGERKEGKWCVYDILFLPFQAADINLMKKLHFYRRLKCQLWVLLR